MRVQLTILCVFAISAFCVCPPTVRGQAPQKEGALQHAHCHHCAHAGVDKGKDGNPESGNENPESGEEGGFAAPPRTGTIAGATQGLGLEGLELEFPAINLKMPAIKFPCLTQYLTPPRMKLDQGLAPLVNTVAREMTLPAAESGLPEPNLPAGPESGDEPTQGLKPAQKDVASDEFRMREQALVTQIENLQHAVDSLLAQQERQKLPTRTPATPDSFQTDKRFQPLPTARQPSPVQPSNYVQRIPEPHHPLLSRLPTVVR